MAVDQARRQDPAGEIDHVGRGADRAQAAGEILPDGGNPLPDDQDIDDAERLRGIDLGPGNDSEHG